MDNCVCETGWILFVPAEWVNVCFLLTLLYVKVGYRISWNDGLITVLLSVLMAGMVEMVCFFRLHLYLMEDGQRVLTICWHPWQV